MRTTRRIAAALAAFAIVGGLAACGQGGGAAGGNAAAPAKGLSQWEVAADIPEGSKDAKVVLIEYASITCPHCANLHTNVLPKLKAEYIDTGKVRYVFREFPTSPVEMAQAGHLIARCAGPDKRNDVINTMMTQQQELFQQAQGPTGLRQAFLTIAMSAGMSEQAFEACLKNEELLKTLVDVRQQGIDKWDVQGTPTIIINGEKFTGPGGREIAFEDLKPVIDAALAKAG